MNFWKEPTWEHSLYELRCSACRVANVKRGYVDITDTVGNPFRMTTPPYDNEVLGQLPLTWENRHFRGAT